MHIIRLCGYSKKHIKVQDIFEKYDGQYVVEGVRFNSDNPDVFNVFQGFKYEKLEQVDESKIDMFINHLTYGTIAGENQEVFEYILNWIAFIAQNAGQKTRTAIVLQGLQRIGKNRFTDAISEMFSRYSQPNISTIEEFTGIFNSVVENVMFAVLNEMINYNKSKKGIAHAMKKIITDKTIRINEKNYSRRRAENVINTIIVTNNDYPIQLDNRDGRYLVIKCKAVHRGDHEYFNMLSKGMDKDFYDNLLTFFLNRDISKFDPTDFPLSDAKKQLLNVCRTLVDDIIIKNYQKFKDDIPISEVSQMKPNNWNERSFKHSILQKQTEQRICIDKKQVRVFKLLEENYSVYDDMINDLDKEEQREEQERIENATEYFTE
ncbi:MAG: hypothetical protein EZS28_005820 [Streblomastix strix]|uniref:NrS-1 polymerase-like helicase domain-containing protein n=1 Tax=Streblomastix strix TaxID=222440 RepID=A0A5J4WUE6_9EUKA|nr:MAG: hypothetical protein EZS28_005820 [Streblomastix strix]